MLAAASLTIDWPLLAGVSLAAYLVGAVPWAYLVVKLAGKGDIRRQGSGNVGATNVARVLGRKYALLVYVLDMLKGLCCAGGALWAVGAGYLTLDHDLAGVSAGFCAIVGHMAPVYLGLRGGKGVATASGAMLALAPWATLGALVIWILAAAATRYVSLSSMLGAVTLPVAWLGLAGLGAIEERPLIFGFLILIALLVVLRHLANIGRLWRGTEPKIGRSSRAPTAAGRTPAFTDDAEGTTP